MGISKSEHCLRDRAPEQQQLPQRKNLIKVWFAFSFIVSILHLWKKLRWIKGLLFEITRLKLIYLCSNTGISGMSQSKFQ